MPNRIFLLALTAFFFLFASCTTMADFDFSSIDGALEKGSYAAALTSLEKNQARIYKKHDQVILLLDEGILLHFDGNYSESNKKLSEAEKLIQEYRAKSIGQAIGSALINDTVRDYAGEDFEDIYTNVFMCLNYIGLKMNDDAMVEMRRFNNKMQSLGARYQALREQLKRQLAEQHAEDAVKLKNVTFHNSALSHYLSMILYRADGNPSEAEVDLRNIDAAFKMQPALYDFLKPDLLKEIQVPKNSAQINFLAFGGKAPVKKEEAVRISLPNFYYKLSLPVMQKRESKIASVSARAVSLQNGAVYTGKLQKIESMENIAEDTFNDHYGEIAMRTLLRSITKTAASTTLNAVGEQQKNGAGVIANILGFFGQLATEVTERADVRVSRYFPGSAYTGSIQLPPGNYRIEIEYLSKSGAVLESCKIQEMQAMAGGALNLAESCCYK